MAVDDSQDLDVVRLHAIVENVGIASDPAAANVEVYGRVDFGHRPDLLQRLAHLRGEPESAAGSLLISVTGAHEVIFGEMRQDDLEAHFR
jgi:hypothetical protein